MPTRLSAESVLYTSLPTPVGILWVAYRGDRICSAMLVDDERAFVERAAAELRCTLVHDPAPPPDLLQRVTSRLQDDTPLSFDLDRFTQFQRAVLEQVASIPRGEVRSYGEIALAVGRPGAARAVGEVMRTNQIPILIPCHRVVRAGGEIGRYTPDPEVKRRLLVLEGALPAGA